MVLWKWGWGDWGGGGGGGGANVAAKHQTQAKGTKGQSIKWSLKIQSDTSREVISVGGQNGTGKL